MDDKYKFLPFKGYTMTPDFVDLLDGRQDNFIPNVILQPKHQTFDKSVQFMTHKTYKLLTDCGINVEECLDAYTKGEEDLLRKKVNALPPQIKELIVTDELPLIKSNLDCPFSSNINTNSLFANKIPKIFDVLNHVHDSSITDIVVVYEKYVLVTVNSHDGIDHTSIYQAYCDAVPMDARIIGVGQTLLYNCVYN